jgi:hypothetical protein
LIRRCGWKVFNRKERGGRKEENAFLRGAQRWTHGGLNVIYGNSHFSAHSHCQRLLFSSFSAPSALSAV